MDGLLDKGPVAVDSNSSFISYKSGVFKTTCSTTVNHAVVLVNLWT